MVLQETNSRLLVTIGKKQNAGYSAQTWPLPEEKPSIRKEYLMSYDLIFGNVKLSWGTDPVGFVARASPFLSQLSAEELERVAAEWGER